MYEIGCYSPFAIQGELRAHRSVIDKQVPPPLPSCQQDSYSRDSRVSRFYVTEDQKRYVGPKLFIRWGLVFLASTGSLGRMQSPIGKEDRNFFVSEDFKNHCLGAIKGQFYPFFLLAAS
jgi:hypothetical protein